jgi:hypothetical protein
VSRDHDHARHWAARLYWRVLGVVVGCMVLSVREGWLQWHEDHAEYDSCRLVYTEGVGWNMQCSIRSDPAWRWQHQQDDCNSEATPGQCGPHDPEVETRVFRS